MENYLDSHAFSKGDDGAWANVMVHLFARVLSLAFDPQQAGDGSVDKWQALEAEIEEWNEAKPDSFNPISFPSGEENIISEIWMLSSYHGRQKMIHPAEVPKVRCSLLMSIFPVVGVQYYYLAKIFTTTYQPQHSSLGIGSFRGRRRIEVISESERTKLERIT